MGNPRFIKLGSWQFHYPSILYYAVQTIVAILISSPVLLPLLQYSQLSTRSIMTIADNSILSLNPIKILDFLFPELGGYAEWILYAGTITVTLVVILFFSSRLRKQLRFWWLAVIFSLVYSFGSYLPLLPYLAYLPGLNLLRVPPRALFITGFGMAILAAYVANALMEEQPVQLFPGKRKPTLFLAAFSWFALLLAGGLAFFTKSSLLGFIWGVSGIILASLVVGLRINMRISSQAFIGCILLFCLVDLGGVNFLSIAPRTPASVFSQGEEAASYLSQQTGLFRIYSPSYSIPQQTAIKYGLQLADGIDPLQLTSYAEFMKKATGVPNNSYSVTMPPFASGDPTLDNRNYVPDAQLLGILNVKYIVAAFPIDASGMKIVAQYGQTFIYENETFLPRAWILPGNSGASDLQFSVANVQNIQTANLVTTKNNPNQIDLNAQGPGLLVLSEIYYPGWSVTVDGVQKPIIAYDNLFRAVYLDSGQHEIEFVYTPWATYIGLVLFIITIVIIVVVPKLMRFKGPPVTG